MKENFLTSEGQAFEASNFNNIQILDLSQNAIDSKIEGLISALRGYTTPLTYLNLSKYGDIFLEMLFLFS
jgi:hypothetical protein